MLFRAALAFCGFLLLSPAQPNPPANPAPPANAPAYTRDGKLLLPANYREWIYLSSGIDMSYSAKPSLSDHSVFDNIFVNPEAYKAFTQTGTWPDKTVMVMEARMAESKGSINRQGHYQNNSIVDFEVHLKDEARFPGKWAFFSFNGEGPGNLFPVSADCYSCHQQHAAVDTTFVQFYPTLLNIAKQKGTLSAEYLQESGKQEKIVP